SSDALLTLINDILDFSKIEANRLDLELNNFDLRHCIESAMDMVAPKASNKGLDLAYLVEPETPGALLGDMTRLRQILVNLLGNGVKFTQTGEVVLTVSAKQLDELEIASNRRNSQPWYEWHFSVRDTGIGIANAEIERLFESFTQLDASTTRQYGGTGLGLAISKRLVGMMNGRLWVESEVGVGSTFHFTIQAQEAEFTQPAYLEQNLPMLRGKRLLVVDDNATNRKIIRLQAQMWGMEVTAVPSGTAALDLIAADEPLDLAVLDMSMPEMDGLMLADEIRAYRDKQSLPLVMLTSIGLREFDERLVHFAAFLTKPIKSAALFDVLAGILSPDASPEQLLRTFAAQATSVVFDAGMGKRLPLRILLAEDNDLNQKMTLLMLERLGYEADVVVDGKEAIAAVNRQPYDVVLMDVQMPVMDGLTATRRIRRAAGDGQPYIIALTADVVENARERCLAAGMNDYVSKPVSVADLVLALQKTQGETAVPPTLTLPVITPPAPPASDTLQFDPTAITRMQMMLGPKAAEMLPTLITDFHNDTQKLLAEMETAVANQQLDDLKRAAHSLKSNSAHFGLMTLSARARALEMQAKSGDTTNANDLLTDVQAAYTEAIPILNAYLSG
ncbi:MAG: response regulator, partial [Anaerolineales bacterium]|nr:response regulator [Anaerolineales bacterium]